VNIWIDFANSPHVLFFDPIMRQLAHNGHRLIVTLRDFSETVGLAEKYGIQGSVIGKHTGRNRVKKIFSTLVRALKLAAYIDDDNIDVAVSHNSYAQVIAGRMKGCKTVTIMDYEGQPANHIAFRLADKIIVPEYFPDEALKKFGVHFSKVYKYKGYKEQVYLSNFVPNKSFFKEIIEKCDLSPDWDITKTILVTIRTDPTMAAYHHFKNPLFGPLLEQLNQIHEVTAVVLPRISEQRNEIKAKFQNLKIPKLPLDGNNLVFYSDLVISAGGTMNREAAVLGTPAFTIFAGKLPAVDKSLIKLGRMTPILSDKDLKKIKFEKKSKRDILKNISLCQEITCQILS
jgi:predicted glycosyltransferase